MVHGPPLAIPFDTSGMAMTLIEVVIGEEDAIVTAGAIDPKTIHGITKERRVGAGATLIRHTFPRVTVVMVFLVERMPPTLIDRQRGNRINRGTAISQIDVPHGVRLGGDTHHQGGHAIGGLRICRISWNLNVEIIAGNRDRC